MTIRLCFVLFFALLHSLACSPLAHRLLLACACLPLSLSIPETTARVVNRSQVTIQSVGLFFPLLFRALPANRLLTAFVRRLLTCLRLSRHPRFVCRAGCHIARPVCKDSTHGQRHPAKLPPAKGATVRGRGRRQREERDRRGYRLLHVLRQRHRKRTGETIGIWS